MICFSSLNCIAEVKAGSSQRETAKGQAIRVNEPVLAQDPKQRGQAQKTWPHQELYLKYQLK